MDFFSRLESVVRDKGTSLCVGLDPRVDPALPDIGKAIVAANRRVVDATAPYVAAYKPNIAFYEAHGVAGFEALRETLALVPRDIPIVIDAKRGDIDATAVAYARAIFDLLGADAVTLSPYMGRDTVDPFLRYEGKGLFLLCRTSNPGAAAFQDLLVTAESSPAAARSLTAADASRLGVGIVHPVPLYVDVARRCCAWSPSIGLVVAGNDPVALRAVREAVPNAWFLSPGIGAQGGSASEALAAGMRADGLGVLVVAARSVAEAEDPAAAARALRDEMNAAREAAASRARPEGYGAPKAAPAKGDLDLKRRFLTALIDTACFKLGDFVLKSGKRSPFYIDLRRLIADPEAMRLAAEAYATVARGLGYDRIAGIPAAALPLATAASLRIGKPMLWPRMPAKEHGTGNRVEGAYESGERALLLDDLITTGASKLEAVEILRGEGLVVEDLVVLIERGRQGRRDMEKAGIALHAYAHVRELFEVCQSLGLIDAERRRELEIFVDEE